MPHFAAFCRILPPCKRKMLRTVEIVEYVALRDNLIAVVLKVSWQRFVPNESIAVRRYQMHTYTVHRRRKQRAYMCTCMADTRRGSMRWSLGECKCFAFLPRRPARRLGRSEETRKRRGRLKRVLGGREKERGKTRDFDW